MKKRIDNRERILRAFEDIPLTLSTACEAINIHPRDTPLRGCVETLFVTLMDEIPQLISILLRQHKGSCKSFVKCIGGSDSHPFGALVNSAVQNIQTASRTRICHN